MLVKYMLGTINAYLKKVNWHIYIIKSKRLKWFVWRADGQVVKEILVNKINGKNPLGRPRTRWVVVITQGIKDIKINSIFDDIYYREKWEG